MSETIRLIAADAGRSFREGPPWGRLEEGDLATWELRGRLVGTPGEEPSIDIDGGQRFDRASGDCRWIVGAAPGSGPGGPSWDELAASLERALRDEYAAAELRAADHAAAWVDAGRPLDGTRIEIRALVAFRNRSGRKTPQTVARSHAELRLRWTEPGASRSLTVPLDERAPIQLPPAPPIGDAPETFATIRAGDYRVILAPDAAAYCLHELAHAALERGDVPLAAAREAGPALLEDPAAAPFPYGFEHDDLGHPAPCSTLWSRDGRHALPAGHARRSSLAAAARPSLSFTRLVESARVPLLDEGLSLRADAVSAARYDPALDRIFLAVRSLRLLGADTRARPVGGGVLSVSADDAWQGLAEVHGEGQQRLVQARCTRLGCVHPVMVGAPTIALRSMHLVPGFPLQQRECG